MSNFVPFPPFNFAPRHLILINFYIKFGHHSFNLYLFIFIIFLNEFWFQFIFMSNFVSFLFITICFVLDHFLVAFFSFSKFIPHYFLIDNLLHYFLGFSLYRVRSGLMTRVTGVNELTKVDSVFSVTFLFMGLSQFYAHNREVNELIKVDLNLFFSIDFFKSIFFSFSTCYIKLFDNWVSLISSIYLWQSYLDTTTMSHIWHADQ